MYLLVTFNQVGNMLPQVWVPPMFSGSKQYHPTFLALHFEDVRRPFDKLFRRPFLRLYCSWG
jgi:hypothetical protein